MDTKPVKPTRKTTKKRIPTDWDAVERDYRTGKFTLRELEAKHKVTNAAIGRRAKAKGWTQDLAVAIKQATNAALIDDLVRNEVRKSTQEVRNTVEIAAEVNFRVIMGHRNDLADTRNVAAGLLSELAQAAALVEHTEALAAILAGEEADADAIASARTALKKALAINSRIASVKQLADTFDKLQIAERRAFAIEDGSAGVSNDGRQKRVVLEFVDVEPLG